MFVKVENFGIESKSKRGFEKSDMHVITIELMTNISPIIVFELKLIPMFFHMDSIREFKRSYGINITIIVVGVRGKRNNKGEKQYRL
jgi:hypothetical protein